MIVLHEAVPGRDAELRLGGLAIGLHEKAPLIGEDPRLDHEDGAGETGQRQAHRRGR